MEESLKKEYLSKVDENINKYGFHITYVFEDEKGPSFVIQPVSLKTIKYLKFSYQAYHKIYLLIWLEIMRNILEGKRSLYIKR
ncbi:MAG: hypothetical protein IPP99_02665 [Chitinophagaceae bacterium]|nr:hypothetical protein [Chitinophagaceae bacterium]